MIFLGEDGNPYIFRVGSYEFPAEAERTAVRFAAKRPCPTRQRGRDSRPTGHTFDLGLPLNASWACGREFLQAYLLAVKFSYTSRQLVARAPLGERTFCLFDVLLPPGLFALGQLGWVDRIWTGSVSHKLSRPPSSLTYFSRDNF